MFDDSGRISLRDVMCGTAFARVGRPRLQGID